MTSPQNVLNLKRLQPFSWICRITVLIFWDVAWALGPQYLPYRFRCEVILLGANSLSFVTPYSIAQSYVWWPPCWLVRVGIKTFTLRRKSNCSWISSKYTVCCWLSRASMKEWSVVVRRRGPECLRTFGLCVVPWKWWRQRVLYTGVFLIASNWQIFLTL